MIGRDSAGVMAGVMARERDGMTPAAAAIDTRGIREKTQTPAYDPDTSVYYRNPQEHRARASARPNYNLTKLVSNPLTVALTVKNS